MCIENLSYPGSLRSFHSSLSGLSRWRIFNPPLMVSWDNIYIYIFLNFANNIARKKRIRRLLCFLSFWSDLFSILILYWFYIKFLFDIVFFFLLQRWFNKFNRPRTSVSFGLSNATVVMFIILIELCFRSFVICRSLNVCIVYSALEILLVVIL